MKSHSSCASRANSGFTILELMMVLAACAAVAVVFLLPRNHGNKVRASRINCANNLKQVGLAFRVWAGDHDGKYPMAVSVPNGGTLELIQQGNAFRHFTVLSNELGAPKVLFCPDDRRRKAATTFAAATDANLSYFICLNAEYGSSPEMWLAGDRSVTNGFAAVGGTLTFSTNSPVGWNSELHNRQGNIVLSDGSVQQFSSNKLRESLRYQTNSPLRLAMPR